MKRTVFCTLALLLALLTPAAANSTPTRLDGVGGSALEVDENCPVMVSAEQLTFQIQRDNDYGRLCAQVTALYQMENPTEEPLTVPMAFYMEERKGQVGNGLEPSQVSVTADGQALSFTQQEVEDEKTLKRLFGKYKIADLTKKGQTVWREVHQFYRRVANGRGKENPL